VAVKIQNSFTLAIKRSTVGLYLITQENKMTAPVRTPSSSILLDGTEEESNTKNLNTCSGDLTPAKMMAHLDSVVVGQAEAKKKLVSATMMHYLRAGLSISKQTDKEGLSSFAIHKTNVLLTGPTGVGKTLMLRTLAEFAGFPFIELDVTKLSPSGYVGDSIFEAIKAGIESLSAKSDYKFCHKYSMVFVDELDKLSFNGVNEAGWYRKIQGSLLKIVEGMKISAGISTQNMMFVFGGNFEEMRKNRKGAGKKAIGFGETLVDSSVAEAETHEQLMKCGIMPELLGRIAVIGELEDLTKEQVKEVILNSKASPYSNYVEALGRVGLVVKASDKEIDEIVERAMKKKIGLRGLSSVLADFFMPHILEHNYENKEGK